MKGDFSRDVSPFERGYSRLLAQQGRMQTDADLNAQAEIVAEMRRAVVRDLIGPAGGGLDAGFQPRGHGGIRFSGAEALRIEAAQSSRLRGQGYTLEGWLRIDATAGAAAIARCADEQGVSYGGFELLLDDARGLTFVLAHRRRPADDEDDLAEAMIELVTIERFATLEPDRFAHVAAVVGDARVDVFVNGVLAGEAPLGRGLAFRADTAHVGEGLVGVIDGLRLWRVALDREAVRLCATGTPLSRLIDLTPEWSIGDAAPREGSGSPDGPGPVLADPELTFGAGRYYVDGEASSLLETAAFDTQPGAICGRLPPPRLRVRHPGPYHAVLQTREVVVSAAEDAALRDEAFGLVDTVLGVKTLSRIRLGLGGSGALHGPPGCLTLSQAREAKLDEPGLLRVEIHDGGYATLASGVSPPADEGFPLHAIDNRKTVTLADAAFGRDDLWRPGRPVELVVDKTVVAGRLARARVDDEGRSVLTIDWDDAAWPARGASEGRLRPLATFKWSKDNAAAVAAVVDVDAETGVAVLAGSGLLDLAGGDILELTDEDLVARHLAGAMLSVAFSEFDEGQAASRVGMAGAICDPLARPPRQAWRRCAAVRRWDRLDETGFDAGLGLVTVSGTRLDGKVDAVFSAGWFESGEAWTCPVRDTLHWPRSSAGEPLATTARHGLRRTADLARIWFEGADVRIEDLRQVFAPLTRIPRPERIILIDPATSDEDATDVEVFEAPVGGVDVVIERPAQIGLPPDAAIFTANPNTEFGWRATGVRLALPWPDPQWRSLDLDVPFDDAVSAIPFGQMVACLSRTGGLWLMDPATHAWERRCTLEGHWSLHGLDGRLHAFRHDEPYDPVAHCVYEPSEDRWRELQPLGIPRRRFGVAEVGGRLYVAGGMYPKSQELSDVLEQYDPRDDLWRQMASLPHAVSGAALVGVAGRLHLFGGRTSRFLSRAEPSRRVLVYAPGLDHWHEAPSLHMARYGALALATEEHVHIIGGMDEDGAPVPSERFNTTALTWTEAPQPIPLTHPAGAIVEGVAYLFDNSRERAAQGCALERVLHMHSRIGDGALF